MYLIIKRLFDVFVALSIILILSPIFILIILILWVTGEHKVFYFQERIGLNNKRFYIWKFATMLKNSPNMGFGTITVRNDPRVTVVGRFLRKSKINEFPQLINVLIGDMSIVGPRPLDRRAFDAYIDEVKNTIYTVKPGITGLGSIIFRDEERLVSEGNNDPRTFYNEFIAPYKGEVELWYIKNRTFFLDLKIIFLTMYAIINSRYDVMEHFKTLPKFGGR